MRFAILLLLAHLTAAIVVGATAMPPAAGLAALAAILLSLSYYLARDILLLLPDSWCEILQDQDSVSVTVRKGAVIQGYVANKTVVSPFFILLRIKLEGRLMPVSRVIFPDTLETGLFRKLCVHLKFALQPV